MTAPNVSRKDPETGHQDGLQPVAKPTETGTEKRLGDLIRDEDRLLTILDPARELRRRACPSGE